MLSTTTRLLSKRALNATRFASTLVVSEPLVNGSVPPATQATVTAAEQLGGDSIELLVVSEQAPSQVPSGVSKVFHVSSNDGLSETIASAIQEVAGKTQYGHIVSTSTKFGATITPRAAALLNLSPVTDVIEILEPGACVLKLIPPPFIMIPNISKRRLLFLVVFYCQTRLYAPCTRATPWPR